MSTASRSLTAGQLAKLLTATSGTQITEEMIQEDVARGAPVRADDTIHVVEYAAWLLKEMAGDGASVEEADSG
jgi:hypothetical protein